MSAAQTPMSLRVSRVGAPASPVVRLSIIRSGIIGSFGITSG